MGIKGLLPILRKILKKTHIGKYSNRRVGIDGHSWIHRIIPYIAADLYCNNPTQKHLDLFMAKLSGLLDYGITPIFVFDGDFLESKKKTIQERKQLREKYRAEVDFFLQRNDVPRARELMKRCVSVTPEILHSILRVLKANNIEFIVSPYEADAQLYFLQRIKYIDYILTEDSDLVVYGATRILYKYDGVHVEEYDSARLHLCKDKYFQENILDICILSGCDYLDSIRGIGIVTAYEKLKELGDVDSFVNSMISLKKNVPKEYISDFVKAKATFLHHIVYNPYTMQRQFLSEPKIACEFLGSLENSSFTFNTHLGIEQKLDRHFIPKAIAKRTTEDKENCSSEIPEDYILDSNLVLPYF
ncbi:uncharacterized protein VICG_00229 [Vittaforma corneae ATCC 50505]|uniref:Uncharacterized protein n=1 Tax=Vittaforma corneae (strain ATCC 50505) TaxID=993615 RepID=L2GQK9_VITCO|nr:uncharacterized protein VICG_00229 [Vittaforma corneae ATCC 50505]ELA42914.1 hypothetical protein VICG_00229 [Vittaforma corneae ATCC 50505]